MKFNEKIQFISEGTESDGAGGFIPSEKIELSTFAFIEQLKRNRDIEQAQLKLDAVYRVRMYDRKSLTITTKMRVKWNNMFYNIISTPEVDDVRMSRFLVFDMIKSS